MLSLVVTDLSTIIFPSFVDSILSANQVLIRIPTLSQVTFICLYLVSVRSRSGGCDSPAAMQHSLLNHHMPVSAPPAPPAKHRKKHSCNVHICRLMI